MTAGRRTAIRLLALAFAAAAVLVLVYFVSVRTGPGQRVDDLAFEGRKATFLSLRRALTSLVRHLTIPFIVVGALTLLVDAIRRRRWDVGGVAVASIVVSMGLARFLKGALPRPELVDLAYATLLNTTPSGHSTAVMALVLAAVISVAPLARGPVTWAGMVVVTGFSIAMTGSGWHRASDVIAGAALATTVVPLMFAALMYVDRAAGAALTAPVPATQLRPPRGPGAVSAVALAVAAVSAMLAVLAQNPPASPEHQLGPFALAVGLTAASASTCVLAASNCVVAGATIAVSRSGT